MLRPLAVLARLRIVVPAWVLTLSILGAPCVVAQPDYSVHPDFLAKHFSTADGLPVNLVNGIVQGQDGYLWMATFDGLARFDGHRFTVFTTLNSPGLASNRLHGLLQDAKGAFWILTESGDLVHYAAERFTTYGRADGVPGYINDLVLEGDTLWVLTQNGLATFVAGQFQRVYPALSHSVSHLLRSHTGTLWIGAEDGLYRAHPDGTLEHLIALDPVGTTPTIGALYEDPEGTLWVGTPRGLLRQEGDRFIPVAHQQAEGVASVQAIQGASAGARRDTLWVGLQGNSAHAGWAFYAAGQLRSLEALPPGPAHQMIAGPDGAHWRAQGEWLYQETTPILHLAAPHRMMQFDREGNLWVATDNGLYRLQRRRIHTFSTPEGLPHPNLYPILQDRQGALWMGTWGGQLARYQAARVTAYPTASCCVTALHEDTAGRLWVGAIGELCQRSGSRCVPTPLPGPALAGTTVRAIHEDQQGYFWIGTEAGLLRGHPTDAGFQGTLFTTENGLTSNWVRAIVETPEGDLFFGTNGGGLMHFLGAPDGAEPPAFAAFTAAHGLGSNFVRDIHPGAPGRLWVALEDRGLCVIERLPGRPLQEATATCLTTEHGLFDNSIHRILKDDFGRFWFNSNRGVFWVTIAELEAFLKGQTQTVTSVAYTERDGMRNREGNGGVQPAGIKAADGRLWFPTQDGAVVINPAHIHRPLAPPVALEAVRIGDRTVPANGPLQLAPEERDLVIDYTAMAFSRPEDVRFRYRLSGYDDAWRDAGDTRQATYTNLPPGDYTFSVRAGLGGSWSEADATLAIHRQPYFWQTRWFMGLVILLFAVAVPGFYRIRLRQVQARQNMLQSMVTTRTAQIRAHEEELVAQATELQRANTLQSTFLANISHEFRTPLTLTFGPLEDLLSGRYQIDPAARPHIERARRNGQRLLRLINQLLDLSRLDAGHLALDAAQHDLRDFLNQRLLAFAALADERGLTLHFSDHTGPLPAFFDAVKLETVVLNLLSNAFKFTPEGGAIYVTASGHPDGGAVLTVRDTGIGIAPAHLDHLFDRFYQVDASNTRAREGSGLGLALVKQIVDLHGGTITVESALSQGTTYTLTLPPQPPTTPAPDERRRAAPADQEQNGSLAAASSHTDAVLADLVALPPPRPEPLSPSTAPIDPDATVVLVVEDNTDMRAYLRAGLEDTYQVEEAENGAAGLERALELVPDLVISDVMMPVMDGVALLAALKQAPATSHIPVLLLTAKADAESRLTGLQTGADDYLTKPFNTAELQARAANLIEGRQKLRALWSSPLHKTQMHAEAVVWPSMEVAFLNNVQAIIEAHMGDAQFSVNALADAVGMSPRQLRRKLRGLLEESPTLLIRRLRLERAAMLLAQQAMSVKEVAAAVGFRSEAHFSRLFHKVYGLSPKAYAQQHA